MFDGYASRWGCEEAARGLDEETASEGPGPGVQQDEMPDGLGVVESVSEADRSAPVVQHEGHVGEVEGAEKRLDQGGVGRGAVGELRGSCRAAKTEIVGGDAPVVRRQRADEMTIEAGTRGVAVEQNDGGPSPTSVYARAPADV